MPDINYNEKKRMISSALMTLIQCARKYNVAVVLVNNMKTGKKEFMSENMPGMGGIN